MTPRTPEIAIANQVRRSFANEGRLAVRAGHVNVPAKRLDDRPESTLTVRVRSPRFPQPGRGFLVQHLSQLDLFRVRHALARGFLTAKAWRDIARLRQRSRGPISARPLGGIQRRASRPGNPGAVERPGRQAECPTLSGQCVGIWRIVKRPSRSVDCGSLGRAQPLVLVGRTIWAQSPPYCSQPTVSRPSTTKSAGLTARHLSMRGVRHREVKF
jgi:hypothetical protein